MKINYRPEIDGLRAIAVLAVIFYHARINILGYEPFKGGFIGVDIFFVISGYLITSIILKELYHKGTFSFKHFYERRIRRIIPVLLLVTLITLPFGWLYLVPKSLIDYSYSILYSLSFLSNFYFPISGQVYGDTDSLLKPFLHTWSLSVEEQYYILIPIFLIIIFKFFRRYLKIILISGLIISLLLAEYGSRNFPGFNFYLIPSRGWELLSGSILAYFEIKSGHRSYKKIFIKTLPALGIILIFHSIIFFDDKMYHPSFYSISPIIGVCLLIWFTNKDEVITKILSSKLFVGIGLISYSLYLWHYPLFAFVRITNFAEENILNGLLVGIILIILSILSFHFIEQPARNKKIKFKFIYVPIIFFYVFLSIISFNFINKKGFEERFYVSDTYKFSNVENKIKSNKFENEYNYNNYDHRKNVLIVGNSHAEDTLKILSKTNLNKKIYFNLTSFDENTLNFQIIYLYKFLKDKNSLRKIYDEKFLKQLNKQYNNADLILLSSSYSNKDIVFLEELIKLIKSDGKMVLIFDNALLQNKINDLNRLDYYVYKNRKFPNKKELDEIEKNMFKDLKNTKNINLKIEKIAKKNQINLVQRNKLFCNFDKKKCPSITEKGYKIYWDFEHITFEGAEFFAKKIQENKMFLSYLESSLNLSLQIKP